MFLFVYGTLKRGYGNNRLLRDAKFLCPAWMRGKVYHLGGFPGMKDGTPGTNIFLEQVKGEVYEITDDMLSSLDRLEGVDHRNPELGMYRRELRDFSLSSTWDNDETDQAYVYIYNGNVREDWRVMSGDWSRKDYEYTR